MADIATYKIQFKSDFVLTIHGDAGWTTPFCIKFWTGAPSQAYFVGWDGKEYINCKVDETDASKLIVLFDDHGLPVGQLKMQMAWHTTIADFPKARFDEVMNQMDVVATVEGEEKYVELAFEGESDPEVEYFLPAYANEAQRIANEEERVREFAQMQEENAQAVEGAENVDAELDGNILTVRNRNGQSTSVNTKGEQGIGVPKGGNTGQVLKKKSDADYDTEWKDESGAVLSVNGKTGDVVLGAGDVGAYTKQQTNGLIGDIEALIPSQASAQNQLADKNFVNSSVSTNTANFVGTYNSLAELQAVQNPTNNDYGFVIEQDQAGNEYYDRYKYVASSQQWLFEYKVESTPFTADQWAAIQSGITSALVTKLSALPTNAELQQALTLINNTLAGKQDALVSGTNIKTINNESILGSGNITIQGGGSAYVPTLNSAPTSSTTTYTKDGSTVDFEIGQFCRVLNQGSYDFYQLYDLQEENNVKTATWEKQENIYADHEDVYIAVTVDSGAPSGTTISGLVINAYYNDASVPTATVTTDANGMAVLRVPNGYKYRLVFPSQTGCETPWDVVHTAAVSQRSVEVEYMAASPTPLTEEVTVVLKNTAGVAQSGKTVTCSVGGSETQQVTDSNGEVTFEVALGSIYTITAPQIEGFYVRGGDYSVSHTADRGERTIVYIYRIFVSGVFIVTGGGDEYTLEQFQQGVEQQQLQKSDALLIKVATQALQDAGGVFCFKIADLAVNTLQAGSWAGSASYLFVSVPESGNNVNKPYYYDGKTASALIQEEGDQQEISTNAVDNAMAATVEVGGVTYNGFLPSAGQIKVIHEARDIVNDIIYYLDTTWKNWNNIPTIWSSTQAGRTGGIAFKNWVFVSENKSYSDRVLPCFAI